MELRPNINKLMRREVYTLLTISLVVVVAMLILQVLLVNFNPDVDNEQFVKYGWSWAIGAITLLWMIVPWLLYLWITNLKYSIDDERLVIHKGIITKKKVSIPYSAVTDFTLSRSLYERWLEIGTIMIQTAGQSTQTSGYEGKLEGLVEFESIHEALRSKIKAYRGSQQVEILPGSTAYSSDLEVLQSILEEVKKIGRKLD